MGRAVFVVYLAASGRRPAVFSRRIFTFAVAAVFVVYCLREVFALFGFVVGVWLGVIVRLGFWFTFFGADMFAMSIL